MSEVYWIEREALRETVDQLAAEFARSIPDVEDRENILTVYYWQLVEMSRHLLYSKDTNNERLTEIRGYLKYSKSVVA